MNCTKLFLRHAQARPSHSAIFIPGSGPGAGAAVSFGELLEISSRAQRLLRDHGVGPGDSILFVDALGPRMFASVIAALGMGVSVILVEPFMPIARIERVIRLARPKVFLTNALGRLWGLRVAGIRAIPHWVSTGRISSSSASGGFQLEEVGAEARGILTFTSGTTGQPKGVSRTHGRLIHQHQALSRALESDRYRGADLCIFANFALANLAEGRASVIVPPSWKTSHLDAVAHLPAALRPETLTTGPAFLLRLMARTGAHADEAAIPSLRSIHVGGALTDCAIFERAFAAWPEAHFTHVYGGSEAEPVAVGDARRAVELSRKRGYFQTLHLGNAVPEVRTRFEADGLWVAGEHVCAEYVGNAGENQLFKRKDADGTLWHAMGDRIIQDADGLWYTGRAGQARGEFELEQRIYSRLASSKSFVVTRPGNLGLGQRRYLLGEGVRSGHAHSLKTEFAIHETIEAPILRDRRHRARIDRASSLRKAAPWLMQ